MLLSVSHFSYHEDTASTEEFDSDDYKPKPARPWFLLEQLIKVKAAPEHFVILNPETREEDVSMREAHD